MLILVLGGARSAKSTLALKIAHRWEAAQTRSASSTVTMIATAPEIPGDDDLAERIRSHQDERPSQWVTVEEPTDLLSALKGVDASPTAGCVIIDCVTLWVNNLLWRGDTSEQVIRIASQTAQFAASRPYPTVVVSNEVGLGIHPASAEGREFRDLLGRVNTIWASQADHSYFLVAGRILDLKDSSSALNDIFPPDEGP